MPLDNFCSTFKNEIINKQALILESMAISTVTNEEEAALAALFLLLKYADKSYLQSINGLVKESDAQWSLESFGVETQLKYERFFSAAASLITDLTEQYSLDPVDLTHFNNIYQMKPGVMYALYYEISNFQEGRSTGGMDDEIADFFQFQSKPFVGVETREDIIMSLPFATASIDDIRDDILNPNIDGYWKTLEEMHQGFVEEMKEKRLMTPISLAKRNHSWLNQYSSLIKLLGDCLAMRDQSHFMGQGGLINLSQEKGCKWFLFQKGTYLPFTYAPEDLVTPILYH